MNIIQKQEEFPGWRFYGKRYLRSEEFMMLCTAVGLYHVIDWELEEYEKAGALIPIARMVMPDEYAKAIWLYFNAGKEPIDVDSPLDDFHRLDWALRYRVIPQPDPQKPDAEIRHPLDEVSGKVMGLINPVEQEFFPWAEYQVAVEFEGQIFHQETATHFYHYWQVYELFQARKNLRQMYADPAPMLIQDFSAHIRAIRPYLEAISYFQYLYCGKRTQLLLDNQPDDERLWSLTIVQQQELNTRAVLYAQETIQKYQLDENGLYNALKGMMTMHSSFETLEKYRLAETLKSDIWRLTEFIYFAFGTSTNQIAAKAGNIAGRAGDYLELLFPNRREHTKNKAANILRNLADEHNRKAPSAIMTDQSIDELLDYLENSELVLFEYILDQTNQAYFARHSWQVAEAFLYLKSLASCPESMMKVILHNSGDQAAINQFNIAQKQNNIPGMGMFNSFYFENTRLMMWAQYNIAGHRSSRDAIEFMANLGVLIPTIINSQTEDEYTGYNLSLATCIGNFTSHLVLERPDLIQNQYVRCIRAITSSLFMIWVEAKSRNWV